jgi:hypothetical protein
MKGAAFHVGNAARRHDPDSAGRSQNKLVYIGTGKALLEAEAHDMSAVEAKKAVGRANPDEAVLVLQDARWCQGAQAEVIAHALENIVRPRREGKHRRLGGLCLHGKETEYQEDEARQEWGGGSLAPHELSE